MIEEVRNFNLDDQVKISMDMNRLYVFDANGDLIFSPYRGN